MFGYGGCLGSVIHVLECGALGVDGAIEDGAAVFEAGDSVLEILEVVGEQISFETFGFFEDAL